MLRKNVKSLVAVGLATTVMAANLIAPIAFTSNHAVHAQSAGVDAQVRLGQILGKYGFDEATFQNIVAQAQAAGGDPAKIAGILDANGIDAITLNNFFDDMNKQGLSPVLDSIGLSQELTTAISGELDNLAAEQFYSTFGLDEAGLEAFLSTLDLAEIDALLAETGLTELDFAYFLDVLDSIDAFDAWVEAYGLEDAYDIYISEIDGALVLEYYGLDEATLSEILGSIDPADPDSFIAASLLYGFDAELVNELVDALDDDAFFTDLLSELGIDLASFDDLLHDMVLAELMFDDELTQEEVEALLADDADESVDQSDDSDASEDASDDSDEESADEASDEGDEG